MVTSICFVASILWGAIYLVILGPTLVVLITSSFTLVVGGALVAFLATKRFGLLVYPFFLMILWNPTAMQWSLGGFAASGVVMTWSLLAPICALMFLSVRQALWWFAAFLALLAVSLYFDSEVARWARPLGHGTSMLFFAMNLIGPSVAIFLSMLYFVQAFRNEHARSEGLLLNILPGPIADRLKQQKEVIADRFSDVTILFADIVDFTALSARIAPEELVRMLNMVFSAFDRLSEKHGLEKIKTIGDSYMVVGGLPEPRPDHAEAVAAMALDMLKEIDRIGIELGRPLGLRIGIGTGPVVAGVIGTRKFAYDLWGDAVNTASRMESQGITNAIQLSLETYQRLKDTYICEPRGVIDVKGKGELQTYLLKRKINGQTEDDKPRKPANT
ncbi:MAG: adenylate/guanylate cyclase domain-containing protein [Alphaproteobacteria bacterium]